MNREEIINSYSKREFMDFLSNDYSKQILELLNEEGLNILEKSSQKEERIRYIMTYSKYKDDLFKNSRFLDILLNSRTDDYYAVLQELKKETYDIILDNYIKLTNDPHKIANLFSFFNLDYKLKKLDNWPYSKDILYEIINSDRIEVIKKVIDNYNIDLSNSNINIERLFEEAKYSVLKSQEDRNYNREIRIPLNFPINMINKDLAKRLWDSYDIFRIRKIISNLEYSINPEEVNNYIKNKEEQIINNYNDNILKSPYKEMYEAFYKTKESYDNEDEKHRDYRFDYIKIINKTNNEDLYQYINMLNEDDILERVYNHLKELNSREISNYIIDYNFEENYHNIMLDTRELLRFYYDGNIILPEERVELYGQISNIDYLNAEEKKELHKKLKKINIKEVFYDDMSIARHIVNESLKEYSLGKKTIEKYKEEKLSKKLGVDIYKIGDEPFFGIVKTKRHQSDYLPTGHSFSLVGSKCVTVFGNPEAGETYLYDADDLNPDQIVHVFPFDSFTLYKPFEHINEATSKVNALLTPEEITGLSRGSYSEILILEKGKIETDIDKQIPELKRIALYCIDEIKEEHIKKAKEQGLGIILVSSKKYYQNYNYYRSKYKDYDNRFECNYFDGRYEKDAFEAKR